jgi:phage-related minor tail protein
VQAIVRWAMVFSNGAAAIAAGAKAVKTSAATVRWRAHVINAEKKVGMDASSAIPVSLVKTQMGFQKRYQMIIREK